MSRERCPKCQAFVEIAGDRCPECGFDSRPPVPEGPPRPHPQKEPPQAVSPYFMAREDWDAATPPKKRFAYTKLGILLPLVLGVGILAYRFAFWERLAPKISPREDSIENIASTAGAERTEPAEKVVMQSPEQTQPAQAPQFLYGRVYDAVTLQPVPAAPLLFGDTIRFRKAITAKNGSYRVELPASAEDGFRIQIAHPRYMAQPAPLSLEVLLNMTLEERRETVRRLAQSSYSSDAIMPQDVVGRPLILLIIPKDIEP